MLKIKHSIVDIGINCHDFDRSLHFYRDCLGLEVLEDVQIPAELATSARLAPKSFRQVHLAGGDTRIKLMEIDSPPPPLPSGFRAGVGWLTFFVENLEETVAALKEKGVEFLSEPYVISPTSAVVAAPDPDGILLEFVQLE